MRSKVNFSHAGLGGTFDRLHRGHQALLAKAFATANHLTLGLTTDSVTTRKQFSATIQPYPVRLRQLQKYLRDINQAKRVSIVPLTDVFGPTLTDTSIDCLIVTDHTRAGAQAINRRREKIALKKLPIITAGLVTDESRRYISSTRIRQGLIDRNGLVYKRLFSSTLYLSAAQKSKLKIPLGPFVTPAKLKQISHRGPAGLFVVGDYCLDQIIAHHIDFTLGIFDTKTQRKPTDAISNHIADNSRLKIYQTHYNPAGSITRSASHTIFKLSHSQAKHALLIKIIGEEDLLVIPLILSRPLGSHIVYGQPNQGMVALTVSESLKSKIVNLLSG